jgi:hypothetical protein
MCSPLYTNTASVGAASRTASQICQQLADEGCPLVQPNIPCPNPALANPLACVAGTCVAESSGGNPDAGTDAAHDAASETSTDGQSCTTLQANAQASFGATVTANQSCTQDSDCVYGDGACFYTCGLPLANITGVGTVNSTSSQLCQQLASEGCPLIPRTDIPCFAPLPFACVAGVCTNNFTQGPPDAGSDAAPDAQACESAQSAGLAAVAAVLQANQFCTQNSDCTIADTGCFDMCSPIVNTAGAFSVTWVGTRYCANLSNLGCPAMTPPPCAELGSTLVCNAGTCAYAPLDE